MRASYVLSVTRRSSYRRSFSAAVLLAGRGFPDAVLLCATPGNGPSGWGDGAVPGPPILRGSLLKLPLPLPLAPATRARSRSSPKPLGRPGEALAVPEDMMAAEGRAGYIRGAPRYAPLAAMQELGPIWALPCEKEYRNLASMYRVFRKEAVVR